MVMYFLVAVVDRVKAEKVSELFLDTGAKFTVWCPGHGTATGDQLRVLALEDTGKAVISSVVGPAQAKGIFRAARQKLFMDIPGNGIMLSVPIKSVAGKTVLGLLAGEGEEEKGVPKMDFEYELIISIMNDGCSDMVMDAARPAGAGGGTVLHAKGTGRESAGRFLGLSLADEKDIVYIVAHKDEKAAIMKAISEKAGLGTKAGAICFSLPISEVCGLRAREEAE